MKCVDILFRIGKKQFWQKRNWNKFILIGLIQKVKTLASYDCFTEQELYKLNNSLEWLQGVTSHWDSQNKQIQDEIKKRI